MTRCASSGDTDPGPVGTHSTARSGVTLMGSSSRNDPIRSCFSVAGQREGTAAAGGRGRAREGTAAARGWGYPAEVAAAANGSPPSWGQCSYDSSTRLLTIPVR